MEGKAQTLSLGSYPLVGLAEAREKRLTAMKEFKAGLNPAAEKQAQKRTKQAETLTFEKTALVFLEYKRENGGSSQAIKSIWGRLKKHILPALAPGPRGI